MLLEANVANPPAANKGGWKRAVSQLDDLIKRGRSERFVQIMDVSPSMAADMLARSKGNRPVSAITVTKYAALMIAGQWKLTAEGLAFDTSGALQNGHHRLNAIVEVNVNVRTTVWFGTDPGEFDCLDGGRSRTSADLIALHGLDRWNNRAALARAIMMMQTKTDKPFDRLAVTQKALELAGPRFDAAMCAADAARKVTPFNGSSLAHYWISTYSDRLILLDGFWEALCTGMGDGHIRPVVKARDLLMTRATNRGSGRSSMASAAGTIILAWNCYVTNSKASKFDWHSTVTLPEVF